jgi:hypothetical protein
MPLFGKRRTKRRITAYRAFDQRVTIAKNQRLLRLRTAETLGYPIPACLQNIEPPFDWCVFEYEGETLFVKTRDGILNDTEGLDPWD